MLLRLAGLALEAGGLAWLVAVPYYNTLMGEYWVLHIRLLLVLYLHLIIINQNKIKQGNYISLTSRNLYVHSISASLTTESLTKALYITLVQISSTAIN